MFAEMLDGLAKRLKSWKVKATVAEWVMLPLAPLIVSV